MNKARIPHRLLIRLKAVTGKRSRAVVDHIVKNGFITTEELAEEYGYNHPPRAARDVREQGIPLETFKVRNAQGRMIAAYRLGDLADIRADRLGGRRVLPKALKDRLVQGGQAKCGVCLASYGLRLLQVDHRVPYEVSGDVTQQSWNVDAYMLLCGSCNRAKSWSCEHCPNWSEERSSRVCDQCYWAHPESYKHIGLRAIRRIDIVWAEDEIQIYERLRLRAKSAQQQMPSYVKAVIRAHFGELGPVGANKPRRPRSKEAQNYDDQRSQHER